MAEYFEISLITETKVQSEVLRDSLALSLGKSLYWGDLLFFDGKELLFQEYQHSDFWEYEFSIDINDLFNRDNVIERISILLATIEQLYTLIKFEYTIANIETNSSFISDSSDILRPSKEMILRSTFIFVPKSRFQDLEINLYHMLFEQRSIVCLFNPKSGILYSSESERYAILKESFNLT